MKGLVVRVDDRLIHGQIMYGWAKGWPADEIWLACDRVADDPKERALYEEQLTESGLGGVVHLDDAIARFAGRKPQNRRILLVVASCMDLARLVAGGLRPAEAHLGNVAKSPERNYINGSVYLGPGDLAALRRVKEMGVEVVLHDLPGSRPRPLESQSVSGDSR